MSSSNTRYKQIVHSDGNSNKLFGTNSTRWPSYDSRWDDPNRILCLAAGAGDLLALKCMFQTLLILNCLFSSPEVV